MKLPLSTGISTKISVIITRPATKQQIRWKLLVSGHMTPHKTILCFSGFPVLFFLLFGLIYQFLCSCMGFSETFLLSYSAHVLIFICEELITGKVRIVRTSIPDSSSDLAAFLFLNCIVFKNVLTRSTNYLVV